MNFARSLPPVRHWALHPLFVASVIGIGFRVAAFSYAWQFPVFNEEGHRVSPLLVQAWIDFQYYLDSLQSYRSQTFGQILSTYVDYFVAPFSDQYGTIISGPVFPLLIWGTGYAEGNTLPLAILFLIMSSSVVVIWLWWLDRHDLGLAWLILFALIPNPIWYTLNITSDMPFSLLVGMFFIAFSELRPSATKVAFLIFLGAAAVLTRSNGPFLVLFAFLYLFVTSGLNRATVLPLTLLALAGILCAFMIYPEMSSQAKADGFKFLGIQRHAYLDGMFPSLPRAIDLILSWLALAGAKILHFVGLRPSIAGVPLHILVLRAGIGLLLLPGIIYLIFWGRRLDRLFVFCFSLPVLLGPTLDRYNLPILGILFYYGAVSFKSLAAKAQRIRRPKA